MSRARKTWVSDTYALKQARFMQLPVAKIERPLRASLIRVVEAIPKPLRTDPETLKRVRTMLRPIINAARDGDGATVRHFAAKVVLA
jgi:hypothetical protein